MDFVTEKYVKVKHVEYIKVKLHYNSVLFFLLRNFWAPSYKPIQIKMMAFSKSHLPIFQTADPG